MSISVIIKALNEERHIAAAIESALAALDRAGLTGEVILADSHSTDRTVEIAAAYPIRIARLADPRERSCGAGPQLGYQYATGDFVCIMDGDMVLSPEFLARGVDFLQADAGVGGVAGAVREANLVSLEFKRREQRKARDLRPGPVDRLNGGGLYRRAAVESAGFFSDQNLHGYEEFDLAVRMRAAGWSFHRLAVPFVDHHGHTLGGYALLWRRYRSRYLFGIGEVLRGAVGRPHFAQTVRDLPEIRLWLAVYAGWLIGFAVLAAMPFPTSLLIVVGLALLPIVAVGLRYRSLALGLYALVSWNAHAIGMALGFLRPRRPPGGWIASEILDGRPSAVVVPTRTRRAGGAVAGLVLAALSAAAGPQGTATQTGGLRVAVSVVLERSAHV